MINRIASAHRSSYPILRALFIAVLWLGFISGLHYFLNAEPRTTNKVLMGYMPVVTNLAAPLADEISKGTDVHFEAVRFGSFAEMAEAFRLKHIRVAFIIAPLAIEMYRKGIPVKIVYIGNRHESTLVVRKDFEGKSPLDLVDKTIAVPIRYSGHLLALHRYLRSQGMDPKAIRTVEIPPPDMSSALAAGGIDGYFVGEPFAGISLLNSIGVRLLDVESIWPKFICNLMIVHEDLIRSHPQWVQRLVTIAVRSGLWAEKHTEELTRLIPKYWNQNPELVRYTFTHPPGRFRFDLYAPVVNELEEVMKEMVKSGLIDKEFDLQAIIDDRFAENVNTDNIDSFQDIMSR